MSTYPITYPVTRAATYAPSRALLGGANNTSPPTQPALKLADNSSYLLLASGSHLLLAGG